MRFGDRYCAHTNSNRLWGRRQFLNAAAGSVGALVVAGTPFMAACAGNAEPARATDDASARSSDPTTAPSQPNISTAQPVAYRLSTRNQRAPCNACKAHAAHRYFASAEVAVASRAHPGCTCTVVANPVSGGQLETWFATTGKVTFDDRWGG